MIELFDDDQLLEVAFRNMRRRARRRTAVILVYLLARAPRLVELTQ